jgi:hypothetical protein
MTPLPKTPVRRAEVPIGKIIGIASICSAIVSGAVAWTVVHFAVAEAKSVTTVTTQAPSSHREEPRFSQNISPPPVENDPAERTPISISAAGMPANMPAARMVSTAEQAEHTVLALQEQYDTNPYFNNRGTLKGYLNAIQTNARQLQGLVAGGASADEVTTKAQSLDAALERTIKRLDELASKETERDQNEAGISLTLKAQLEQIRASLPMP